MTHLIKAFILPQRTSNQRNLRRRKNKKKTRKKRKKKNLRNLKRENDQHQAILRLNSKKKLLLLIC
jgi:hypothetical protein